MAGDPVCDEALRVLRMKTLRRIWCALAHIRMGESIYTRSGDYAGILWTCRDCKRKWVRVDWDFEDEFCPDGTWGKHERD